MIDDIRFLYICTELQKWPTSNNENNIIHKWQQVHYFLPVYAPLTDKTLVCTYAPMIDPDAQGEALPGLSLQEWLDASEMSYSAFSRLIPCTVAYPRKIALGLSQPSYRMACRIEEVTNGAVPRERWFPPGKQIDDKTKSTLIEDLDI